MTSPSKIKLLLSRLNSNVRREDKLDALNQIVLLSKDTPDNFMKDVSKGNIKTLVNILSLNNDDSSLLISTINILRNLLEYSFKNNNGKSDNIIEILGKEENIKLIFILQSHTNIYIKQKIIAYLILLTNSKSDTLSKYILSSDDAINSIIKNLSVIDELVRNDSIILIKKITKENKSLSKLMVFSGILNKILDIIKMEEVEYIIINDCLDVMENLLYENIVSQKYFCEKGAILIIPNLLSHKIVENTSQNTTLLTKLVKLIFHIIQYNSSDSTIFSLIGSSGLIISLLQLTACEDEYGIYKDLKILSFKTIFLLVATNELCKNILISNSITKPNIGSQGSIVYLLCTALDNHDINVSKSSEEVIDSYFLYNPQGQLSALSTFSFEDIHNEEYKKDIKKLSFGNIMIDAISSYDENNQSSKETNRFCVASRILSYIIKNNKECKEKLLLLKIRKYDSTEVFLTRLFMDKLFSSDNTFVKFTLLLLLCTWFYECPKVIRVVFKSPKRYYSKIVDMILSSKNEKLQSISTFIIALCLEFTPELSLPPNVLDRAPRTTGKFSLILDTINNQIGIKRFKSNLDALNNLIKKSLANEYSYFAKMFTVTYPKVNERILEILSSNETKNLNFESHNSINNNDKFERPSNYVPPNEYLDRLKELKLENRKLKNENAKLKKTTRQIKATLKMNENYKAKYQNSVKKITEQEKEISVLKSEGNKEKTNKIIEDYNDLNKDVEDLLVMVGLQETEIKGLKSKLKEYKKNNNNSSEEKNINKQK